MLGSIIGFLSLSHIISFVLKKHYDSTISLLTGFVVGSLLIIWPWKVPLETILGRNGDLKVISYNWILPDFTVLENIYCFVLILVGIGVVFLIEFLGKMNNSNSLV